MWPAVRVKVRSASWAVVRHMPVVVGSGCLTKD